MINLKKIVALVCTTAMIVTMLVMPASAGSFPVTLTDGETSGTNTYAYFTLNLGGMDGLYTKAGTIKIRFTPGVFSASKLNALDEEGLYSEDEGDGPSDSFTAKFVSTEDYDQVTVTWVSSWPLQTTTGKICEVRMKYANDPADVEAWVVNPEDDNVVCVSLCDESGKTTVSKQLFDESTVTYKIAAGTSTVTEVVEATATPEPVVTPTPEPVVTPTPEPVVTPEPEKIPSATAPGQVNGTIFGGYTGDESDADVSAAVAAGLMANGEIATKVLWTVTANGETGKYYQEIGSVDGDATIKVGLIIFGLAQSAIETVTAVLQ